MAHHGQHFVALAPRPQRTSRNSDWRTPSVAELRFAQNRVQSYHAMYKTLSYPCCETALALQTACSAARREEDAQCGQAIPSRIIELAKVRVIVRFQGTGLSYSGKLMAVGRARMDGVEVHGNSSLLGMSGFEAYAKSTAHRPAQFSFTSNGLSLQVLLPLLLNSCAWQRLIARHEQPSGVAPRMGLKATSRLHITVRHHQACAAGLRKVSPAAICQAKSVIGLCGGRHSLGN